MHLHYGGSLWVPMLDRLLADEIERSRPRLLGLLGSRRVIRAGAAVRVWPGKPYPLGAAWDGAGTNFAVFSEVADRVELCLFDADDAEIRVRLPTRTSATSGTPTCPMSGRAPATGSACTANAGPTVTCNTPRSCCSTPTPWRCRGPSCGIPRSRPDSDEDSAPYTSKSVVVNPWFDWGEDRRPGLPWHDTVLYEAHVRGLTKLHPDVPAELRGTYLGLCSPPVIEHLTSLGVTAVELMPVHQFVQRPAPGRAGPPQLLGVQLDRLLRSAQHVRDRR